ncbi:hypothetical protein EalM132_00043 [Exiguobacterium phage vB_EalM-132]|nr:hypothetical protein EalM132_00043 [Exiguobacterium phage vB_EalM-132]
MDLIIQKAILNTAKLVRKPVQVKGKGGQVFTRMQWVNPYEEQGNDHGVRKIQTHEDWKKAKEDGIHHHEKYHEALKDQKVSEDTHEDHHPHFHLPETKESRRNMMKRLHQEHYADVVAEHHNVHGMKEAKEHISEMLKFGLAKYPADTISTVNSELYDIMPNFRSQVAQDIAKSNTENYVKNVQIGALSRSNVHPLASNPVLLRHFINEAIGEDNADKLRERLSDTMGITANTNSSNIPNILEKGYKGADMEHYLNSGLLTDKDKIELRELLESDIDDHESMADWMNKIGKLHADLYERVGFENSVLGLHPNDRKPTYLAFNPNTYSNNGLTFYGDGMVEATNLSDILAHSTATRDDSFMNDQLIPKIYGVEHLKDIHLLKLIENDPLHQITNLASDKPSVTADDIVLHAMVGDTMIPIELQYHKSVIPPQDLNAVITQRATKATYEALQEFGDLLDPKSVAYEITRGDVSDPSMHEFIEQHTGTPISYYQEKFGMPVTTPEDKALLEAVAAMEKDHEEKLKQAYEDSGIDYSTLPEDDLDDLDDLEDFDDEDFDDFEDIDLDDLTDDEDLVEFNWDDLEDEPNNLDIPNETKPASLYIDHK